jgi:PKD repeat protein
MKKFLIQIMFMMLVIPAMAQSIVYIGGTITDIANGNPLINHNVYISDSASGYYYMAHSDSSGFYSGSIPIPSGSSGKLYVSTYDCNTQLQQEGLYYDPLNLYLTQDFQICSSNAPCQANFYYDTFANRVFHFFDTSTGNPTSWNWTFGDGGTSTVQNPEHWYNSNGWFTVTLSISTSTSCTSNITINVYADASYGGGCSAAFTVVPDSSNNPPNTFYFINQSTGNIDTWLWDFGDGTSQTVTYPSNPNVVHTYQGTALTHIACLTVEGTDSACFDHICDTVASGSGPGCIANFTYSSSPNTSTPTQFTDLSQSNGGGPITLWYWVFDDIASGSFNTSELRNPTHLFAAPGYHNVSLFIAGEDTSCTDIIYKTVFVESNTPIYISLTGTVRNSTTGDPAPNHAVTWGINSDTSSGPHTVYTNSDGVYSDSIQLPQGMLYGTYYAWTDYCDLIQWFSSDFSPNHYDLQWDFNHPCDSNQLCHAKMKVSAAGPLTVQFEDKSTGDPTSRLWDFGDGNTSALVNPIHTYGSLGDFVATLSITNNANGCTNTTSEMIHFSDSLLCNASFSYSDTINPRTIQFNDLSSGGSGIRYWHFGDGDTSTMSNPIHTYRHPGLYLVDLSISNNDSSCWDGTSKAILVDDTIPYCQAYFAYTPGSSSTAYTIQFQDQSIGYPETWSWNFGDSTYSTVRNPVHVYPGPGVYLACLTISGNNCTSTFCMNVFVEDSMVYHQIYGQVFEGNFPLQMGVALIFSLDSTENYSPYVDVCNIDSNGVYYFTLVPGGNYLVYAIPADSNGYLPTYYGNVLDWEVATIIPFGEPDNPYNIYLIPAGNMPVGPGSIGGQVNMGNLKSSMMDKITMLLQDEAGKTISFDRVSVSGSFAFPTLSYGTYYLHAEMSGITSDYVKVILTAEKPHADVVMTFAGKKILGINNKHPELEAGVIYPNPSTDKFNLELNLTEAVTVKVEIFSQTGQLTSSMIRSPDPGKTVLTLSTADMAPGFYTLRITSDKGINLTRKLLITR